MSTIKNNRQTKERYTGPHLPRKAAWHCAGYWFSPAAYWSLMFSSRKGPAKLSHVSRRHTDNAAHWLLAINSLGSWISLNPHHHASIQQTSVTASHDLQIKALSRAVLPRLAPSGPFHCHHHYSCYVCYNMVSRLSSYHTASSMNINQNHKAHYQNNV